MKLEKVNTGLIVIGILLAIVSYEFFDRSLLFKVIFFIGIGMTFTPYFKTFYKDKFKNK